MEFDFIIFFHIWELLRKWKLLIYVYKDQNDCPKIFRSQERTSSKIDRYRLEKPYAEFQVSMCITSGTSPRCFQIVIQGL